MKNDSKIATGAKYCIALLPHGIVDKCDRLLASRDKIKDINKHLINRGIEEKSITGEEEDENTPGSNEENQENEELHHENEESEDESPQVAINQSFKGRREKDYVEKELEESERNHLKKYSNSP